MNQYISQVKYVKSFMSKEDAKIISDYAKENSDCFKEFGNGEKEFTVHTYHGIESNSKDILDLLQLYAKKVYDYTVATYPGPFQEFYPFKTHIAKFVPGDGMHEHFDSGRPNDIATLVYLNNDYVGGDIYFPEYNISFKPEPGDLLMFPDNPSFVHGVKAITEGIRYTTPRWFTRIVW